MLLFVAFLLSRNVLLSPLKEAKGEDSRLRAGCCALMKDFVNRIELDEQICGSQSALLALCMQKVA